MAHIHNKIIKHIIFNIIFPTIFLISCSSKQEEKLVVGISPDNKPYEFIQNGELKGFDVDFIKEVAKRLNKSIEFKTIDFHGLIPSLNSQDTDLLISQISPTQKRRENVDFSEIYNVSNSSIITNPNFKINSVQDLENKILAAQLGSTLYFKAKKLKKEVPTLTLKTIANLMLMIEELKNHNVDAMIVDVTQGKAIVETNQNLNTFNLDDIVESAIAIRKDSILKDKINDIIHNLKQEGFIKKLEQKWFD